MDYPGGRHGNLSDGWVEKHTGHPRSEASLFMEKNKLHLYRGMDCREVKRNRMYKKRHCFSEPRHGTLQLPPRVHQLPCALIITQPLRFQNAGPESSPRSRDSQSKDERSRETRGPTLPGDQSADPPEKPTWPVLLSLSPPTLPPFPVILSQFHPGWTSKLAASGTAVQFPWQQNPEYRSA